MPELEAKFSGLKELDVALQGLTDKLQRNVLRAGLRAGAKEIAEEAKRLVPVRSGRLRDTIRVTSRNVKGVPTAKVVAGGKAQGKKKGAFYAHLVERGTAAHSISARAGTKSLVINGRPVGRSVTHSGAKKKPFMRPALDGRMQAAVERTAQYIRERLTKQGIEIPDPIPEDAE